MPDSIFRGVERRASWGLAPRVGSSNLETPATKASSCDAPLLAILESPRRVGETFAAAFARKERELAVAFAALPIFDQRALHARLANPRSGDLLAEKFGGLVSERRRLLAFLGDARRRASIAAAKGARR